jgi:hypothetical protein
MALYVLVAEGYTDCALVEAILEKMMGFKRYGNMYDMPELFQKLVGNYPSSAGEMKREDMPHFYFKEGCEVVVKVAGGESKITKEVEHVIQAELLCADDQKIRRFLIFADADDKTTEGIISQFQNWYAKLQIDYKPRSETIIFEGEEYAHSIYIYPQRGIGAVEKILLEMTENIYPDLFEISFGFRSELMKAEFCDFRRENWVSEAVQQDFYADKVQFGSIASALKPDRPVGFAVRDKLIRKENMDKLNQMEEFRKLYDFLTEKIA